MMSFNKSAADRLCKGGTRLAREPNLETLHTRRPSNELVVIVSVNYCRINVRKNFFCERIIKVWNSLPPSIVNFELLLLFRNSLNNINLRIYTMY